MIQLYTVRVLEDNLLEVYTPLIYREHPLLYTVRVLEDNILEVYTPLIYREHPLLYTGKGDRG